jgi:hypothetical protein
MSGTLPPSFSQILRLDVYCASYVARSCRPRDRVAKPMPITALTVAASNSIRRLLILVRCSLGEA